MARPLQFAKMAQAVLDSTSGESVRDPSWPLGHPARAARDALCGRRAGALLGLAWVYKVLLGLFAQAMVGVFLRGLASSGARSWLGH